MVDRQNIKDSTRLEAKKKMISLWWADELHLNSLLCSFRQRSGRKVSQLHRAHARRNTRLVQVQSRDDEVHFILCREDLTCLFLQASSGSPSSASSCTLVSWPWASCWCVWKWFASVPRGRWTPSRSTPSPPCAPSSQVRTSTHTSCCVIRKYCLISVFRNC